MPGPNSTPGNDIYARLPILQQVEDQRAKAIARQTAVGSILVPLPDPTKVGEVINETTVRFVQEAEKASREPIRIIAAAPAFMATADGMTALLMVYTFERLIQ